MGRTGEIRRAPNVHCDPLACSKPYNMRQGNLLWGEPGKSGEPLFIVIPWRLSYMWRQGGSPWGELGKSSELRFHNLSSGVLCQVMAPGGSPCA